MTDFYAMVAVQLALASLLAICLVGPWVARPRTRLNRKPDNRASASVIRGPESRRKFGVAYGFASVLILQIINSSQAFVGNKVLLSLFDLGVLFYLCFLNGWFRNKLIVWINAWENAPER